MACRNPSIQGRQRPAEYRQEPDDETKTADEPARQLVRKMQLFAEIDCEDGGGGVICDTLENFGEIGDPEGTLEPFADFLQALAEAQMVSPGIFRQQPGRASRAAAVIVAEVNEDTERSFTAHPRVLRLLIRRMKPTPAALPNALCNDESLA
jgi:hypothetical protein